MTRHLDLLASAPKRAPKPTGLPWATLPAAALLLAGAAAAIVVWSQRTRDALEAQLRAARSASADAGAAAAPRLDAAVIAALRTQVLEREADAAALLGDAAAAPGGASASQWLAALDEAGLPGVALNQIRIESGARLTLAGAALRTADVHAFIARLQQHPLAGTAAIGQLEIRRAEANLTFRLTPPAPEAALVAAAPPSDGRGARR